MKRSETTRHRPLPQSVTQKSSIKAGSSFFNFFILKPLQSGLQNPDHMNVGILQY